MDRIKVIANPSAGRGIVGARLPLLEGVLRAEGAAYDLVRTSRPGEAVELARQAKRDGFETVVAVGGDGTIHEIVNGLFQAAGDGVAGTLGIVPLGSGNDFVKILDIPGDPVSACRHLFRGKTRLIDAGRLNNIFFVNSAGTGFDALVALESHKIKRLTGLPRYFIAVLRTLLLNYQTPTATITFNGQTIRQRITLTSIGNGRSAGGGFLLTPDATCDDGLFDMAIARALSRRAILGLIPHVLRGTHIDKEPVTMARAAHILIELDAPLPVYADGEIIFEATQRVELEVLPRRLRVIG
ncbi:MAG: hypothetical protein A2Z04_02020 [Chloroflexi bacterium RBG_16_57_9]|nr:MAG: hypothetical protein A2Z04_02020 [Chloroflexi bacterium RBG_16_57_9]